VGGGGGGIFFPVKGGRVRKKEGGRFELPALDLGKAGREGRSGLSSNLQREGGDFRSSGLGGRILHESKIEGQLHVRKSPPPPPPKQNPPPSQTPSREGADNLWGEEGGFFG